MLRLGKYGCLQAIALCALAGCSTKDAKPAQTTSPSEEPETRTPEAALDPSTLPTQSLAELARIELTSQPPCSDTIETLRPTLESVASFRKQLVEASDAQTAALVLGNLSKDVRSRVPAIAVRGETDELRRISAELTASVGDLADSIQAAADALTAKDQQASTNAIRRIDNGVSNTRSSIERLIRECG